MARPRASLIYVLSLVMTGLTSCAYNAAPPGIPVAATIHAARCSRSRRARALDPAGLLSFLAFLIGIYISFSRFPRERRALSASARGPINRCRLQNLLLLCKPGDLYN